MIELDVPEEEEEEQEAESEEPQEQPEEEKEEVIVFKPKMKLFSGKSAAGLRIRSEPSFVVSCHSCTFSFSFSFTPRLGQNTMGGNCMTVSASVALSTGTEYCITVDTVAAVAFDHTRAHL